MYITRTNTHLVTHGNSQDLDLFYQWFVGFSDAEACFKIKPRYRDGKKEIHSFSFEFEIHLHIDDLNLLKHISASVGTGRIFIRKDRKSCSFVLGNEEGIRILLNIFDHYPLNGIKQLDYLDSKEAFLSYFNRSGLLSNSLRDEIFKLKEGLNTGRVDFYMPKDHKVKITPY